MAAPERISRGFHRLAIFVATFIFLIGGAISIYPIVDGLLAQTHWNDRYAENLAELSCARDAIYKKYYADMPRDLFESKVREKFDRPRDLFESGSKEDAVLPPSVSPGPWDKFRTQFDLKDLGCSTSTETKSAREIFAKPPRIWLVWSPVLDKSTVRLLITLALSLALYGLVRAIGWVIGGFAS